MQEQEHRLPLGVLRHAMKFIDIGMSDLREAIEDDEVDEGTKARIQSYAEILGDVNAGLINIISDEIGESEFLAIEVPKFDDDPEDNLMGEMI